MLKLKEKGQKDKQRSTKHIHKTKDRVTRIQDSKYSFMILTILYLLVSVVPVVHIVLLHISMVSVQYCDVRYDFHVNTMFAFTLICTHKKNPEG
jgi:hypothetical protein